MVFEIIINKRQKMFNMAFREYEW